MNTKQRSDRESRKKMTKLVDIGKYREHGDRSIVGQQAGEEAKWEDKTTTRGKFTQNPTSSSKDYGTIHKYNWRRMHQRRIKKLI